MVVASDKKWRTGNNNKATKSEGTRRTTRLADAFVVDGYGESDLRIKCCVGKEQIEERGMSMCGRRALRYEYRCVVLRVVSFIRLPSFFCVLLSYHEV